MKIALSATAPVAAQQRKQAAGKLSPRPRRARPEAFKAAQGRAQQKRGAYKRLELFLGLEAATALRRLMRDGRSAREVIEALLLEEALRRQGRAATRTGCLP